MIMACHWKSKTNHGGCGIARMTTKVAVITSKSPSGKQPQAQQEVCLGALSQRGSDIVTKIDCQSAGQLQEKSIPYSSRGSHTPHREDSFRACGIG